MPKSTLFIRHFNDRHKRQFTFMTSTEQTSDIIDLSKEDAGFSKEVISKSGVNIHMCWHCKTCSGGCPFSDSMDYFPNQIIRLVQLGMKEEALESSTIWICVGCHTCSIQCPQAIDIPAIMDVLRQMAIKKGVKVTQPHILNFHKEVVNSIRRHGRTHKLEIMMRYKLSQKDWFADMDVGLKMMQKRKLDLMPSKIRQISDIRKLFHAGREGADEA
jgi:heterodisulfide reductase subunit C2